MRIAQWGILRFSLDPEYILPEFPAGYWPSHTPVPHRPAPASSHGAGCGRSNPLDGVARPASVGLA